MMPQSFMSSLIMMLLLIFHVLLVTATATKEADTSSDTSSDPILRESSDAPSEGRQRRSLQLLQEGDTVGTAIVISSCAYEDSFTDPRLGCNITTRFASPSSSGGATQVVVDVALDCASPSSTFTFRQVADGCVCSAAVTSDPTIACSCAVCPQGFGENGIFVDCKDDILIDTCSSVDCDYTCNGPNVTDIITSQPSLSPAIDRDGGVDTNNDDPTPTPDTDGSTPPPSAAASKVGGPGCLFMLAAGLAFSAVAA